MDEVSEVFSVMSRSVEFIFRILESVSRNGAIMAGRSGTDKETEQKIRTEKAKAMAREGASGSMDVEAMRRLYGNSALATVLIPQEDLQAFLESANQIGVPFSMSQTYAENGQPNGVLITYSKTNEALLAGVLQSVEARHLGQEENALPEESQPFAALNYKDYMTGRKDHGMNFEFVTCELRDPVMIGSLDRELHKMQVPHRFSSADGRWDRDPARNTYLTFMGERTQDVQSAMKKLQVQLKRPPDYMHAQVYVREGLHHALHRARYEAQEAEKCDSRMTAGHLQLTGLLPEEGETLIRQLRSRDIGVVADYGNGTVDILILGDDRKRAAQCLNVLGIRRDFRLVSELEMEKVWLPRAGADISRLNAGTIQRRGKQPLQETDRKARTACKPPDTRGMSR